MSTRGEQGQQYSCEASIEPTLSLDDALALDGGGQHSHNGVPGSFSTVGGHNSDFSFILAIGSPDSVKSNVTLDPTMIRFDQTLTDESSPLEPPDVVQSNSNESSGKGKGRLHLPANANRWMDDSEHPKSVCSRTSYMGMLGLTNHLIPIQDTDDEHEVVSHDSSDFEAGSFSTSESFAVSYNDEPAPAPAPPADHYHGSPKPISKNPKRPINRDESNCHIERSPGDMMGLTLKMQQLNGVGSLPLGNDEDDDDDDIQYNPGGPRPAYLDSLHSLNTLFSEDNFRCNTTDHTTSTFSSVD
ncbi:unnamed protein product [Cylindrotheca closterium]|uniref:Uncharacterized protein n=1 Tax=Cylindrotheca closterium TaxID=2856 RepID=A0AAD2JJQ9_9STRA|nr:unnamed protein product [Cylindrotheca closterium]